MTRRPDTPSVVRIDRHRPTPVPRTDGALALGCDPAPAGPDRGGPLRLVRPGDDAETELRPVAEAALRVVAETLAGIRPIARLSSIAVPDLCRELDARRTARAPLRVVPPLILRTWLQLPGPAAVETGAVITVAGRTHALALRLEHLRGRWRCTAIETTAA